MANNRDIAFDLLKGIGILLVVIGHLCAPFRTNFIESFHMPLFFLVAGYFFQQGEASVFFKKSAIRLLLPFLITFLIIVFFNIVTEKIFTLPFVITGILSGLFCFSAPTNFYGIELWPVLALWFLVALFLSKNIYNFLYRLLQDKLKLGLSCSALAGCGIYLYQKYSPIPFCICQALEVLPYLFLGNMYKETSSYTSNNDIKWYLLPLILIWTIAIFGSHERISDCEYSYYPLDFVASLVATYITYLVCKRLGTRNNIIIRYISWLGKNSLAILCIHDLEWHMRIFTKYIGQSNILHVSFVISLSTIMIFVYDSLIRFLRTR